VGLEMYFVFKYKSVSNWVFEVNSICQQMDVVLLVRTRQTSYQIQCNTVGVIIRPWGWTHDITVRNFPSRKY